MQLQTLTGEFACLLPSTVALLHHFFPAKSWTFADDQVPLVPSQLD